MRLRYRPLWPRKSKNPGFGSSAQVHREPAVWPAAGFIGRASVKKVRAWRSREVCPTSSIPGVAAASDAFGLPQQSAA